MNYAQVMQAVRNATEELTPQMALDLLMTSPAKDYACGLVRSNQMVRDNPRPGDVVVSQALASGFVSAYLVVEYLASQEADEVNRVDALVLN